jgi:hypothetical protein
MLEVVESCLFVVCLDRMSHNCSDKDRSQKDMFRQVLTAGKPPTNYFLFPIFSTLKATTRYP